MSDGKICASCERQFFAATDRDYMCCECFCKKRSSTYTNDKYREERFAAWGWRCAYCLRRVSRLQLDHVISEKELSERPSLTCTYDGNVVPTCVRCNCSKKATDFLEWYLKQDFFCITQFELVVSRIQNPKIEWFMFLAVKAKGRA